MDKFAFVSRHAPTKEQIALANQAEIELVHVGDRDAFGTIPETSDPQYQGIVGVHPMTIIQALKNGKMVGVFENISRPGLDGKPQFTVGRLVVVTLVVDDHLDVAGNLESVRFETREIK